jgi:lysophospholipase L1-like esterase
MCVGDSITMGQTTYRGGWRRLVNDMAPNLALVGRTCTDGGNQTYGQHEGVGGRYVATHISTGIVAAVDSYAPALVVLMLGTNDIYYDGLGGAAASLANVASFAETLAARSSVRWLVACNMAPLDPANPDLVGGRSVYTESVAFRAGFTAAFAAASSKISTCDPWTSVTNPGADFTDAFHPSEAGYAKAAPVIFEAIRARGIQTSLDGLGARWRYV